MRAMKDSGIEAIGIVPSSWTASTVLKNIRFEGGSQPPLEYFSDECLDGYVRLIQNRDYKTDEYATYVPINLVQKFCTKDDVMVGRYGPPIFVLHMGLEGAYNVALMKAVPINIDRRFMYYYLQNYMLIKYIESFSLRTAGQSGVNPKILKKYPMYIPPFEEQQRIVSYLDSKCSKIDSIITKKQQLIEKLKDYKQAVITEAVTKGLNPDVPMKDSGIEWIGEIPEHWNVVPLTKKLASIVDYRGKTPEKVDEGVFLVTARNIKHGKIDYSLSAEYVRMADYDEIMHRGKPNIGDVLFTTEAPLGEVANVDRTDIALAQRIIKFATLDDLDPYYLKYWIMSTGFQSSLKLLSTGSTAEGIKASKLNDLRLVFPPLNVQRNIVKRLNDKVFAIDEIISRRQQLITKLQEYKKSLIYEVVTGKREVPVV